MRGGIGAAGQRLHQSEGDITLCTLCNAGGIRGVHEASEKTVKFRRVCASHRVFSLEPKLFFCFCFRFLSPAGVLAQWRADDVKAQIIS